MVIEITQALSSVKTVSDLVMLAQKLKVDAAVRDKAVEAQTAIISLQQAMLGLQAQFAGLIEENKNLKQEIADIQKWELDQAKYKLTQIAEGVLVYVFKEDLAGDEPLHWLCANCFHKKQKSILQLQRRNCLETVYSCPECNAVITILPR